MAHAETAGAARLGDGPAAIESDTDYRGAVGRLNRGSEAPSVLRLLMRALEAYREARKLGWSRPWNKYGVRTFQAFRLRPVEDRALVHLGIEVLSRYGAEAPSEAAAFVRDLVQDEEGLMGFLFVHEIEDAGERWEGATLSLGRKARGHRRHRDRLDLILESRMGVAPLRGPDRLRIFIDPFEVPQPAARWSSVRALSADDSAVELYRRLGELSFRWSGDEGRVWSHWSTRYIDYFGPRRWTSEPSHFPRPGGGGEHGPGRSL